ncbi:TAXI family TRAP transporter solute-binding subunit [uncultured Enterovirga sp.]|uniref:TAXI family TRAP transporter solute-binding subunit n=1 Tax=uncultured Enterovirga sp. TaxID=2026352 RepID=UPI0035CA83ED
MRIEGGLTIDKLLVFLAAALIAAGVGYAYLTAPTTLTVVVGPADSPETRLFQTFAQQLKSQRVALRLRIAPSAGLAESAKVLDDGKADLAVVRPDIRVPENGLTLAIMREAAAIIVAPEGTISDLSALSGKAIGVVLGHEGDPGLITTILKHVEVEDVKVLPLAEEAILPALKAGRIQAAAIVTAPTGMMASTFVRALASGYDGKVDVLGVEGLDALVHSRPELASATIPAGVWGSRPKRPEEDVKTVGVSYRLMAHKDLDRSVVALLTESLFQTRSRLAMVARSANSMRAPEMDTASSATSATLPNHPGSVDYFQRETQSVMDRYGDWIYLGAFFGSGLLSAVAAFYQRFRRRGREKIDDVLDRLIAILSEARGAENIAMLDELSAEIDGLLSRAVEHARDHSSGPRASTALVLALDGARASIAERRRDLIGQTDPARREGGPRLVTAS